MKLSKQEYQKAYFAAYNHSRESDDKKLYLQKFTQKEIKRLFYLISLLTLPLIFVFLVDTVLLNHKPYDQKLIINQNNALSTGIVSNEIRQPHDFNIIFSSLEKYHFSKFEDKFVTMLKDNKNKFSKTSELSPVTNLLDDQISLKNLNLPKNVSERKKQFINIILPVIIDQNRKILADRKILEYIQQNLNKDKTLSQNDQKFLKNLASNYSVKFINRHKIDVINDLLISVDIIPNSIVIAQAANESGWGSSRFATEYNALFGEYTYDNNSGVVPLDRNPTEKHLVKFFPSINKSIESYFNNINTHRAYDKFREIRNIQRKENKGFNVNLLIDELNVYAEDNNYVRTLRSIINKNNLVRNDIIPTI